MNYLTMKKILITNNNRIYLRDVNSKEELIAIRSTKEICTKLQEDLHNIGDTLIKKFKDYYGIDYKNVIAYGAIDNIDKALLTKLISYQYVNIRNDNGKLEDIKSYKCFNELINENDVSNYPTSPIQHRNKESSWECLTKALNKPEYIIIYKREKIL